jgi:hypothetical protein
MKGMPHCCSSIAAVRLLQLVAAVRTVKAAAVLHCRSDCHQVAAVIWLRLVPLVLDEQSILPLCLHRGLIWP